MTDCLQWMPAKCDVAHVATAWLVVHSCSGGFTYRNKIFPLVTP